MKLTPLYNKHLELGATLYTSGMGYRIPSHYAGVREETLAVRENVGMIDLSLMTRFDLKGKDALALTQKLIVNDAAKLKDGQALYSTMCNSDGLIVDDVVVMRFDSRHFRIITSSLFRRKTYPWIQQHMSGLEVSLTDVSSGLAMIGVQGPKSRALLRKITDIDLDKLGFFRFASGKLHSGAPCLIARLGFSGELGYECYFNTEDGVAAWEAIAEAGKPLGLVPYGMETLDSLRLDKGFIFFGHDVTDKENPYECGLSAFIRYDCGDFIGRDALLKIQAQGPAKKLLGLEVSGADVANADTPLMIGGRKVGRVVIGFHSITLDRNLAYAYIDTPHAEPGKEVTLEINGGSRTAKIVEMPFLDPEGKRLRS